MDDQGIRSESHADEVDPTRSHCASEPAHSSALVVVDCVDRIAVTGAGPDFDHDGLLTVPGDEIHFTTAKLEVAIENLNTVAGKPPGGDVLTPRADLATSVGQSLSSVFSSFSTLTSRKVRTCTFSRNRAGRNMSHTQASVMVTSK